jgi:hypothetical protein
MPIRSIASKQAYEQLWQSADTVGTVLLTLVLDSYGQEIFDQDPQASARSSRRGSASTTSWCTRTSRPS